MSINNLYFDERLPQSDAGSGELRGEQDANAECDTRLKRLRAGIVAQDAVIQGLTDDLRAERAAAKLRLGALAAELDLSKRELASVYASTSWKLTRPLRIANAAVWALIKHLISSPKRPPSTSVNATADGTLESPSPTIWSIDADPDVLSDWNRIAHEASRNISGTRRR